MSTKGPNIAPRSLNLAPSPIASAGSPSPQTSFQGSTPKVQSRPSISKPISSSNTPKSSTPGSQFHQQKKIIIGSGDNADNGLSQIITSKEWVLPPRPKPGRKPSVDTPASKRKAQNRAAQRAFRERRATRVQELEEKLLEVEKEKEIKEMGLVNTINKLKIENQFLAKNLDQLRSDVESIKSFQQSNSSSSTNGNFHSTNNNNNQHDHNSLSQNTSPTYQPQHVQHTHKQSPIQHPTQPTGSPATSSTSSYSVQQISPAPSADSPPLVQNNNNPQIHNHSHLHSHSTSTLTPLSNDTTPDKQSNITGNIKNGLQNNNHNTDNDSADFDCGICLKDECLCASVGLKDTSNSYLDNKSLEETIKYFKPVAAVSLNKKRKNSDDMNLEIDFTQKFTTKKLVPDLKKFKRASSSNNDSLFQSSPKKSHNHDNQHGNNTNEQEFNESSPLENCGFCSDDTPCVCREAAKEAARLNESLNNEDNQNFQNQYDQDFQEFDSNGMPIKQEEQNQYQDENVETSLPPIQLNSNSFRKTSLPVMHPGPSVEIREITNLTPGAVPTVVRRNTNGGPSSNEPYIKEESEFGESASGGGCTGNPGACAQCQTDPMSTLFCATVANKVKEDEDQIIESPAPMSAGSPTKDFGVNTNKNSSTPGLSRVGSMNNIPSLSVASLTTPSTPIATTPGGSVNTVNGMFIPCADAYKTLSRHKKFNSVDFSTLVGKLTTRGMQVEVQSVANVLRELDRRLYN